MALGIFSDMWRSFASTSTMHWNAGAAAAISVMSLQLCEWPALLQWRWHSCRIQSPVMFFSSKMDPSAPPSLVKFSANAWSEVTGSRRSTPIKLHVPLLMKALLSSMFGMAATALAVSCEATATTGNVSRKPVSRNTSGRIGPNCVPGNITSGRMETGISTASRNVRAQPHDEAYIWVVVASECSTVRAPQRK